MTVFPSEEWLERYREAVNANAAYREAAAGWRGDVAYVVEADLEHGLPQDIHIWMDLEEGACRQAKIVSIDEAERARFTILGPYLRWKEILRGELDPIKALTQGKLRARGDIPTLTEYRNAFRELVRIAEGIPTAFVDER